jgi:hypothetical protein
MAVTENFELIPGLKAAADLSALRWRIMKLSAEKIVNKCTAATDHCIGVLTDKPAAAGRACAVADKGVVPVEAGAAVSIGDLITSDSVGRGITSSPSTANHGVIGKALTAATAAGQLIQVELQIGMDYS